MSYDLFFRTRSGTPPLTAERFEDWFQSRPHYQVSGGEAVYGNGDTGVYFTFNFASDAEEALDAPGLEDDGEPLPRMDATFTLNYHRPHVFALEAEPEVAAFVAHFGLEVEDPQTHGMGSGPYSREAFLRGWNAGNTFSLRPFDAPGFGPGEPALTLPSERIERIWRWNLGLPALRQELGEAIAAPPIGFLRERGQLVTYAPWVDGLPVALPEVERVVLVRDALARGWLLKRRDAALADFGTVAHWVKDFPVKEAAVPYRLLAYTQAPRELVRLIKELPAHPGELTPVAFDQVLDAELVARARAG
jgi:hypothetical protein